MSVSRRNREQIASIPVVDVLLASDELRGFADNKTNHF